MKANSKSTPSFFQLMALPENRRTKYIFYTTSVLIFTLPMLVFYISYRYLLNGVLYDMDYNNRVTWSATLAFLTVQVVVWSFVYIAVKEKPLDPIEERKDSKEDTKKEK